MLTRLWTRWKRFAQKIGDFQARVILTILYYIVLGLAGVFVRLLRDPLHMKRQPRASAWVPKPLEHVNLETARRQF